MKTPLLDVGPKVLKKVDIFMPVHAQRKKKVETAIKSKKSGKIMYSMHEFGAADFKALTSMEIWWEDWYVDEVLILTRMRQINFPEYYDSTDIIMDLNFYNNMLKRGVRPYPGGCSWAGAKKVLTVMNINVTHFVTLDFMIEEGVVNVYDYNVPVYDEDDLFCFMQLVMELWPKLLKQSGMSAHLPAKLLNESWEFNRLKNLPRNVTSRACGSWSIAFMEALLTGTTVTKFESPISDNSIGRMQWRWALGVIEKVLEP
ncbi:uncharacterized protein LOC132626192 isoform X2 [Lycium barbarum]|uniref:uncharacterized protein LOC132626192 isoform X2 n=1 Tax=Lycium barbarum TaxID=112863 RepID=UPI00293EDA68|nr:uncharacterized protein LOC132626192 isoform X2 [Lycium barbarum]